MFFLWYVLSVFAIYMAGGIVSPFLLIQNPRLKSGVLLYTADSIKVALYAMVIAH